MKVLHGFFVKGRYYRTEVNREDDPVIGTVYQWRLQRDDKTCPAVVNLVDVDSGEELRMDEAIRTSERAARLCEEVERVGTL